MNNIYNYNSECVKTIMMIMANRLRFSTLPISYSTLRNFMNDINSPTKTSVIVNQNLELKYKSKPSFSISDVEIFNDKRSKRNLTKYKVNFESIFLKCNNIVNVGNISTQKSDLKNAIENGMIEEALDEILDLSNKIKNELINKELKYTYSIQHYQIERLKYENKLQSLNESENDALLLINRKLYLIELIVKDIIICKTNIQDICTKTEFFLIQLKNQTFHYDSKETLFSLLNCFSEELNHIKLIRIRENKFLLLEIEYRNSIYFYLFIIFIGTNTLCRIFSENKQPQFYGNEELIKIDTDIYQFPNNIVYVRSVYKEIWMEIRKYILFQKMKNIEIYKKYLKIIKRDYNIDEKTIEEKVNQCDYRLLLRGNPGCGKTSFIIYLLMKINQLENEIGLEINTQIYISNQESDMYDRYILKNGIIPSQYDFTQVFDCEIAISDSYDLKNDDDRTKAAIFLYVTSPDEKNYKSFNNYFGQKECFYMDVFDDGEIDDWIKYCLSSELQISVKKNEYNKRYGNVPRHIYYAAIYDVYYGRNYWDEIYTKGIDKIIGDLGYINFIEKYLYPCKRNQTISNRTDINSNYKTDYFDSTLYQYIIKYSYINYHHIREYEMEFISDDVFDYIMDSIRYKADKDEIKYIQFFFNRMNGYNYHPLYQLLFQELVWYKFLYQSNIFSKSSVSIYSVNDIEKFKQLFDCKIFQTNTSKVYLLHLATFDNKEVIYLMNNCLIHVLNDDRYVIIDDKIKKCVTELSKVFNWKLFYYICIEPEDAMELCFLNLPNISTYHGIETNLNIDLNIIQRKFKYNAKFKNNINIMMCKCRLKKFDSKLVLS